MKIKCSALLSLLLVLSIQTLCPADPSNSKPESGINTRAQSAKEVEDLYLAAKAGIESSESSAPSRLNDKVLGNLGYTLHMLQYKANRLACYSETAAVDYLKRRATLNSRLGALVNKFRGTPAGAKALQKIRGEISSRNFQTKRANSVAKIKSLISGQKPDQAEQLMLEVFKVLDPLSTIYPNSRIYDPFGADIRLIEQTQNSKITKAVSQSFAQERETLEPDFAGALATIDQAISSVESSGKASWEGAEVTGPQLLEKIGEAWAKIQVASLRCRTLDFLINQGGGSPIEKSCDKFGADVVSAMVKLIEADALRVDATAARTLYVEYLKAIAPLARQSADDLQKKMEPALEKLIAKSPELKTEVDGYRMATEDQLFWRQRVSEAMAAQQLAEYPLMKATHFKANVTTGRKIKIYPASSSRPVASRAYLSTSAPVLINNASPELLNAKVTCVDLLRYKSSKGLSSRSISRYGSRCYTIVPVIAGESSIVELAASSLKADLMVSAQAPALTLDATYAVVTADRVDLLKVGGSVYELYLESLVTRFGTLKDSASIMVPLGRIGVEDLKYATPMNHVLMRYGVDPHWVQHDYFFVGGLKQEGS